MNKKDKNFKRKGQIMLVSIMVLGGVMIGTTAVAGLIFLMQREQVTDAVVSARALAAADSGMEHINFLIFQEEVMTCGEGGTGENNEISGDEESRDPLPFEASGTFYEARCNIDSVELSLTLFSEGFSENVTRVLQTVLLRDE